MGQVVGLAGLMQLVQNLTTSMGFGILLFSNCKPQSLSSSCPIRLTRESETWGNLAMLDTPIWNIQSLKLLRRISDLTKDLKQVVTSSLQQIERNKKEIQELADFEKHQKSSARAEGKTKL
ncbi:unnamed protein product [Effrenium voratum]|nr:unnamed protein product [Effrenium voratum]